MQIRLLVFLLLIGSASFAQNAASSPYSSQGLGETSFFGSSLFQSLGGSSVSLLDSTISNIFNPASYSFMAEGLPQFSMGYSFRSSEYEYKGATSNVNFANLTHFSLIVPFAKRFGLGFGIRPTTRIGYDISDFSLANNDTTYYKYQGTGGLQQAFFGGSIKLLNTNKHQLGVGVNGEFLFGFSDKLRRTYQSFGTSQAGGIIQETNNYRGFSAETGLNYAFMPTTAHRFTVGVTYRPELTLNQERSNYTIYHFNFFDENSYDTLLNFSNQEGEIVMPAEIKLGLTYQFFPKDDTTKNRILKPSFLFTGEYEGSSWSTFQSRINNQIDTSLLGNSTTFRLGFEYTPHRNTLDRSTFIKYPAKIKYRAGYYMSTLPFTSEGEALEEFGISFGLGLPVVVNRAVSSVNIGFVYGQRGNGNINTINENFWGINFGVHLSPGFDRWFRKYKYD